MKMEKPDLKESVLVNLRSVTQSCKGGVPLTRLNRDYKDLVGSTIPFNDLGYSTLEAFIKDIPDVIYLREERGQIMAEGVADTSTAHIVSLVSRQKKAKSVGRPIRRTYYPNKRGGFPSRSRGGSYSVSRNRRSFRSTHSSTSAQFSEQPKPTTTHHSKSPSSSSKVSDSKPAIPPAKASGSSFKKYEMAPRFRRQMELMEAKKHSSSRSSDNSPVRTSPDPIYSNSSSFNPSITRTVHYNSGLETYEDDYNNFLQTPRSLLPKHNTKKVNKLKLLETAQTAKEYIEIYADIHNLTVKYDTILMGQKKKAYTSVLKLEGNSRKTYRSYPQLASCAAEAEEIAASCAMEDIQNSKEHLAILPETSIRTDEDVQILLNRIEEIVCEKPTGMFTHGISDEYENKFQESLPKGWVEKLRESSRLEVDQIEVAYGRVPDGINLIVRPARGFSSGSTTPSEVSASASSELFTISNGDSIPNNCLEHPVPDIPDLIVPAGNEWAVYITSASTYITARLVDYDEEFIEFTREMVRFYSSQSLPVYEVHEKQLYAAISDPKEEKQLVQRVLANKVYDDWVECYIVDEGQLVEVKKSDLQELHNDFFQFPFQAVHLSLDGLEDYEPFMKTEDLDFLIEKTLICVVKRFRKPDEEFFPEGPGILRSIFSVVLYDTSDNEIDICLNDEIKRNVLRSCECKLPKLGTSTQGYLTHITENGEIYLRFLHPAESLLEIELEKFSDIFEIACLENIPIPAGKVCVAKFEDGRWYRAVLPEKHNTVLDPDKLEVLFIDYGHFSIVQKSEICLLEPEKGYGTEFLAQLGNQAIKCELYNGKPSPNFRWTSKATQKLIELAPFNKELIVRVIEESSITLPKVNLYTRVHTEFDSHIISINEELANRPQLFLDLNVTPESFSRLNHPKKRAENSSSSFLFNDVVSLDAGDSINSYHKAGLTTPNNEAIDWLATPDGIMSPEAQEDLHFAPLSPPQVPEIGEFFNVFVTLAATPHNFIIQPLSTAVAMDQLRTQMQQFYSTEENLFEKDQFILKKNCFYAALHSDGEWYRVRVVSVTENTDPIMAAVYYVDFGDFNTVSIQNLQVLWKQFRTLPCQAIKASLSGIKPIAKDWNPVHCVKFKEMVTEKNFVSIIKEKNLKDEQDFFCLELGLILVDTSDSKTDVYINDLLVDRLMAQHI